MTDRDSRTTAGVVATVHPLASEAGADALRRGGNAVDAAVAAALTLGVVDAHNSGIGGGCFLLVRRADGSTLAIDGREVAPAGAARDMFVRDGKVVPGLSTTGALAVGVPGSLAAYDHALRAAGRLTLADLLRPAADVAERGFPIDATFAQRLNDTAGDLARFPASAAVFLDGGKRPWSAGHVLRQPELAAAYRAIARDGVDWFYKGAFADAVDRWMRENGGVARAADFASYRVRLREPLVTTYRGHTVIGFPPPSSGGVHVAQILNVLEAFDLARLERDDPARRLHVTAEAMKLAFADRAAFLGDPEFAKVPRGLVSKAYARTLAARIDPARATPVDGPGSPPNAATNVFGGGRGDANGADGDPAGGRHTTHVAAADAEGNWVALTTTLNTSFGSKVVVPGTGVLLNNQMDDFSTQPGVPNAFGLVGAEANAVAPGKRPLSSMSPTIVLDAAGQPVLACGAAGGPTIISQVVQAIVNRLDLGMSVADAVAAPRVHHQWRPDELGVEERIGADAIDRLRAAGHAVKVRPRIGASQAVGRSRDGVLVGASDPRVEGKVVVVVPGR